MLLSTVIEPCTEFPWSRKEEGTCLWLGSEMVENLHGEDYVFLGPLKMSKTLPGAQEQEYFRSQDGIRTNIKSLRYMIRLDNSRNFYVVRP